MPHLPSPNTFTTPLAVNELRAADFTDADVACLLGEPDMAGPREAAATTVPVLP